MSIAEAISKSFHPSEARDYLPMLALAAMLPDGIACVGKRGPAIAWLLRLGLCLFLPWRFLVGSRYLPTETLADFGFDTGAWSTTEAIIWIGGLAAILLTLWITVRLSNPGREAFACSALAVMVALGGAITMAMSSSLIYAQLLGVLTASLVGCGLASLITKSQRGPEAAAGPVACIFSSLMLLGFFYAELKSFNAALLILAMSSAIGWLPRWNHLTSRRKIIARCLLCLSLLVIVLLLAGNDFAKSFAESQGSPYG
jgi:hypothetical protein